MLSVARRRHILPTSIKIWRIPELSSQLVPVPVPFAPSRPSGLALPSVQCIGTGTGFCGQLLAACKRHSPPAAMISRAEESVSRVCVRGVCFFIKLHVAAPSGALSYYLYYYYQSGIKYTLSTDILQILSALLLPPSMLPFRCLLRYNIQYTSLAGTY